MAGVDARRHRFQNALSMMQPVYEDDRRWANECEEVFGEFRTASMHLRKDPSAVDDTGDKEIVWLFLARISKERKPLLNRCEEVVKSLVQSDEWMKAFNESGVDLNDLPAGVADDLGRRATEMRARSSGKAPGSNGKARVVVIGCGGAAAYRNCAAMGRYNEQSRNNFFKVVFLYDSKQSDANILKTHPDKAKLGLNNAKILTKPEDVIDKQSEFDAVVMNTHSGREDFLRELLSLGKMVFLEPPFSQSMDLSDELSQLAEDALEGRRQVFVAEPSGHWADMEALSEHPDAKCFAAEGHSILPGGVDAADIIQADFEGGGEANTLFAPGLRYIRVARQVVGPILEATGTRFEGSREGGKGESVVGAFCMFRHDDGAVSSLRVQTGGTPAQAPPLLRLSTSAGDVLLEAPGAQSQAAKQPKPAPRTLSAGRAPASPQEARGESGSPDLAGEDRMWNTFAMQCTTLFSDDNLEQVTEELDRNMDEHMEDLAVLEALRISLESNTFEGVSTEKRTDRERVAPAPRREPTEEELAFKPPDRLSGRSGRTGSARNDGTGSAGLQPGGGRVARPPREDGTSSVGSLRYGREPSGQEDQRASTNSAARKRLDKGEPAQKVSPRSASGGRGGGGEVRNPPKRQPSAASAATAASGRSRGGGAEVAPRASQRSVASQRSAAKEEAGAAGKVTSTPSKLARALGGEWLDVTDDYHEFLEHDIPTYQHQSNGLFVYFWDDKDDQSSNGWYIADEVGSDLILAQNAKRAKAPPGPGDWQVKGDDREDGDLVPEKGFGFQVSKGERRLTGLG